MIEAVGVIKSVMYGLMGRDQRKEASEVVVSPRVCGMKHRVWKGNARTGKYV